MWLSCVFISLWSLFRVRFCSFNMNAKKEVYYETNLQRKRQSKSYIHILDGRRCRRFWCIHSVLDSIKSDDDELGEPMGNTLKSSSLDLIRRIKSNEKKVNITTRSHPWKWKWNKSFNVQMSTFDRWWFQIWDLYVFLLSAMLCSTSFLVFSFFLFALRSSIFSFIEATVNLHIYMGGKWLDFMPTSDWCNLGLRLFEFQTDLVIQTFERPKNRFVAISSRKYIRCLEGIDLNFDLMSEHYYAN